MTFDNELKEIIGNLAWKIYYKQCDSLYLETDGIKNCISDIKSLIVKYAPKDKY